MNIYNFPLDSKEAEELREKMLKSFSSNLRKIRLTKNLTQEQLAEAAGINPKYLSEVETSKKNPTAIIIHRLAGALDIPVCRLFSANGCRRESNHEVYQLLEGRGAAEIGKAEKILKILFE